MAAPKTRNFDGDLGRLRAAARRWAAREKARTRNVTKACCGCIDEVESAERMQAHAQLQERARRKEKEARRMLGQERQIGDRDFLGIEFVDMARAVARFVGRVNVREQPQVTAGFGTGFMVSPRLLLTNNHVLPSAGVARFSEIEFDYQNDRFGHPLPLQVYRLEPDTFFLTDKRLDFALVAVALKSTTGTSLESYSWVRLRAESGKTLISQPLNIIQHPRGEMKQLVVRSNRLVDQFKDFIHYETDTEPGSSGSPVFSDYWDVAALHHSSVPKKNEQGKLMGVDGSVWKEGDDPERLAWVGNEGIRVSSLVKFIGKSTLKNAAQRQLRDDLLNLEPAHPLEYAAAAEAQTPVTSDQEPRGVTSFDTQVEVRDGQVSVTLPLSITVRLGSGASIGARLTTQDPSRAVVAGGAGGASVAAVAPVGDEPGVVLRGPARPAPAAKVEKALATARRELLGRPYVLRVDAGYVFENGWITDERAIVVTTGGKRGSAKAVESLEKTLPAAIEGVPVQVVGPALEDLVALVKGPEAAEAVFREGLLALGQEITYKPLPGTPLKPVTGTMKVTAHLSPDTGWPLLQTFLAGTKERLVVGMYDFGAPHIVKALEALAKPAFQKLTLVMQREESLGSGSKKDDLSDEKTVEALRQALGAKFENAWVTSDKKQGSGWIASAYHIKVAVRDRKAFWLSSGNWQSSNQPDARPLEGPKQKKWLNGFNREWHAIVESAPLAKAFEAHLLHDFKHNKGSLGAPEMALPDVLVPRELFGPDAHEVVRPFEYFPPFSAKRRFTVRPLLTPDNYLEHLVELIGSAQNELLIQNQTFSAPKGQQNELRTLMDAVRAKQRAGVTVRIIFRVLNPADARKNLERLKDFGFDLDDFRLQKNCHTKGIVVDKKRVLLGSQNLSSEGVSVNRDASLLFDDAPLAEYFAKVFDHDWNNLAKQDVGTAPAPIELAPAGTATPEGMVRLDAKDYLEML
jgi:V8-like Glu-specific endopeptidase